MAYLPVETPTGDFYGGHRPGNGLFGETIVAVDLKTGQRKWHYQLVHHGIWDWDIPCAPMLVDFNVNAQLVKAVAQPTKQSILYVFDRVSDRQAYLADQGKTGASGRCSWRMVLADPTHSDETATIWPHRYISGRTDRLHPRVKSGGDQGGIKV